jgi:hypothetical protein
MADFLSSLHSLTSPPLKGGNVCTLTDPVFSATQDIELILCKSEQEPSEIYENLRTGEELLLNNLTLSIETFTVV